MHMFCYQCQETGFNRGCVSQGICGKDDETANLQDLLIHTLRGIALCAVPSLEAGRAEPEAALCVARGLFTTVTNTNFDAQRIEAAILEALAIRNELRERNSAALGDELPDAATWNGRSPAELRRKSLLVDIRETRSEGIRSLRELCTYGLKGAGAYLAHAAVLGHRDEGLEARLLQALAGTACRSDEDALDALAMEVGRVMYDAMALLDRANADAYGEPGSVRVPVGTAGRPGILITGHDLKDLEELLDQTAGTGIDIYTHSEMWAAHAYPRLSRHSHLRGNYGGAWHLQEEEFESFGGPILVTSNCIVPPRPAYRDRLWTTGVAGFPGIPHIPDVANGPKDFSALVQRALTCPPPRPLERGDLPGGYNHRWMARHLDELLALIRAGRIRRFVVMAGCDGRDPLRAHFTRAALDLPPEAVILTAGCAKYRYIREVKGEVGGFPRVLDAGQCNDTYSLIRIALALQEALGAADINDLPLEIDLAWYDQKAVGIVLALAALGVRRIHMGPTLPAFLLTDAGLRFAVRHDIHPTRIPAEKVPIL